MIKTAIAREVRYVRDLNRIKVVAGGEVRVVQHLIDPSESTYYTDNYTHEEDLQAGKRIVEDMRNPPDIYGAMIVWDQVNLCRWSDNEAVAICQALVDKCVELGIEPGQLWCDIVKTPSLIKEIRQDVCDGLPYVQNITVTE